MRILNRYEARGVLGLGGEATVVRAWDHRHGRYVALKLRTVAAAADRRRMLAEAGVLLRAAPHPNVVLVRDDFFFGDQHVMVMDLVAGVSLADRLRDAGGAGLPPAQVVAALGGVAAALDHLHAHSPAIVHGDVKPSNIVTVGAHSVLVDFGLASGGTSAGSGGSRGYAAPELASGVTSPASDVYSLAATAHALLAGVAPAPGVAGDWSALPPETVARVRDVLARGLAVRPEARPASARVFVDALVRALRVGRCAPARPVRRSRAEFRGRSSLDNRHSPCRPR